jgi:hypothetical protein
MPRYYFNVVYNMGASIDNLAEELPDDEAAWRQATVTVGEMFKDIDGKLRPGRRRSSGVPRTFPSSRVDP